MSTQRKGDHLDRRIPESQEEGTFDRDLHETLDLTVGQINELEEQVDSFLSEGSSFGGDSEDLSDLESEVSDLESQLDSFIDSVEGQLDSLADRVEEIELEARDEVFTEPIELRAGTSEIVGSGPQGVHTVEFDTKGFSFKSERSGKRPLTLRRGAAEFPEKARFLGGSEKAEMWVGDDGRLKVHPQRRDPSVSGRAPGDVEFEADEILPAEPYETSLGSQQRKYQSIHAAELWVDSLVAQEKIATIGGSVFVGPTTELTRPLSGNDADAAPHPANDYYNYIRVKHNQMAPGDIVMLDNFTRVEFLRIEEGPVEIEAEESEEGGSGNPFDFYKENNYRYRVERDVDGSGANTWGEGAAVANTGRKGSGFIDLYATRSRRAENESGPSIAISVREEDKRSYGQGAWAPNTDYQSGDIVYWDSDDWEARTDYQSGDIVYYSPRDQHYVAQTGHTADESDKPLEASAKWSACGRRSAGGRFN